MRSLTGHQQTWNFPQDRPITKPTGFKELARPRYEKIGLGKRLIIEPAPGPAKPSLLVKKSTMTNNREDQVLENKQDAGWLKRRAAWKANEDAKWEAGRAAWFKEQNEIEAARKSKWEAERAVGGRS